MCLGRLERVSPSRLDTNIKCPDYLGISNAAIHNDALPTIVLGKFGQHISEYGHPIAPPAIDDENSTIAWLHQGFTHHRIAFEASHCLDLSMEALHTAVITKVTGSHY